MTRDEALAIVNAMTDEQREAVAVVYSFDYWQWKRVQGPINRDWIVSVFGDPKTLEGVWNE